MARSGKVQFTGIDTLAKSLEEHDRTVQRVVLGQFLRASDEATTFAKTNAPWTDHTTNARSGLHSDVKVLNQGRTFDLIVAHSEWYGFWLEVRFSGKFAIIMPTVNHIGGLLLDRLASSLGKMGSAT